MSAHKRIATTSLAALLLAPAPSLPADPPTKDVDMLRSLHDKAIRAHRESDAALLVADQAADMIIVNRGAVTRPSLEERRASFGSYLGRTVFSEYRDLVEPVVKVSSDGSLGWVIVQVGARGVQAMDDGTKKPIEFVSAWIELYEKRDGRWYAVGNVSNFRP
jgi:hypothetical protein